MFVTCAITPTQHVVLYKVNVPDIETETAFDRCSLEHTMPVWKIYPGGHALLAH